LGNILEIFGGCPDGHYLGNAKLGRWKAIKIK
jgi:hypothetical protein